MGGGLYMRNGDNCRAGLLCFQDVEMIQQHGAIAVHVEDAAAYAAIPSVTVAKPAL